MKPVSTACSSSISYRRIPELKQNFKQTLIKEWEEWADNAEPGRGEDREIALAILKAYFINNSDRLNLSDLALTELPDNLPPNLTYLNVNHNQLTHLPKNLPESLLRILLQKNNVAHLPHHLPSALKEIDVRKNPLSELPANFPNSIKIFVDKNQIKENYSENKPIDNMLESLQLHCTIT